MTKPTPFPGNDPGLPSIEELCERANKTMDAVADFVAETNAAAQAAGADPRASWTPEKMRRLADLQAEHSQAVEALRAHPDGDSVGVTEGPAVGGRTDL